MSLNANSRFFIFIFIDILCVLTTYLLTKNYVLGLENNDDNFIINILWVSNKGNLIIMPLPFLVFLFGIMIFGFTVKNFTLILINLFILYLVCYLIFLYLIVLYSMSQ